MIVESTDAPTTMPPRTAKIWKRTKKKKIGFMFGARPRPKIYSWKRLSI